MPPVTHCPVMPEYALAEYPGTLPGLQLEYSENVVTIVFKTIGPEIDRSDLPALAHHAPTRCSENAETPVGQIE